MTGLRYTGGGYGGGIIGVPARDLTDEDIEACAFTREQLLDSGLYVEPITEETYDDAPKAASRRRPPRGDK